MRLAILLSLVALTSVQAQITLDGRRCATPEPSMAQMLESVRIVEQRSQIADLRVESGVVTTIPVAFHVITAGAGRGDVPDGRIQAQIDTLNSAFAPLGYQFALALVQRVENGGWYDDLRLDSPQEAEMKRTLALDPARFLNIYTASLALDYLGWAYIPDAGSETFLGGGIVLLDESLPGGSAAPYNLGHTGTHEVGHWAGLAHTFAGGCTEPNDGVADTPQERSGASGCPVTRDSCPLDPGTDPVTNYMDYSNDACMTEFTAGQTTRVRALLDQFRPTISTGGYAVATVPRGAFAETFVGVTTTADLRVTNTTAAPFEVTSVTSAGLVVDPGALPITVPAGEAAVLPLSVSPTTGGDFSTTVVVRTSSAAVGDLSVPVQGRAALPPTARLPVASLESELVEGASITQTVVLANDGDGALSYAIDPTQLPEWVVSVSSLSGIVVPRDSVSLVLSVATEGIDPGSYAETLGIVTNDPVRGTVQVALALDLLVRPNRLRVGPVFPNPGSGTITIPLQLPDDSDVQIDVFDARGRRVAVVGDGIALPLGYPEATWDARGAPAGVYLVRVTTATATETARVVILR